MGSSRSGPRDPIVIALGGNAISRESEEGNVPQQFANTRRTAKHLVDLVELGYRMVVTHGNGPQVGNVLRRVELAAHEIYTMPLDVCGAHTQGGMGYMIAQCLNNELRRRGLDQTAAALVTMVEVDRDDPELAAPTKPIGKYYGRERAEQLQREHGWRMADFGPKGYRRVVPSPRPRAIIEAELIMRLANEQRVLVAAGGGGVPVICNEAGELVGVEAVVDKDRTSALLAQLIEATTLVIATGVERVAVDFGKSTQRFLDQMSVTEARRHLADGQFPAGSMGPKIESAVEFLTTSSCRDARVIICGLNQLSEAVAGRSGTHVTV
jgi:carbamate kinase